MNYSTDNNYSLILLPLPTQQVTNSYIKETYM